MSVKKKLTAMAVILGMLSAVSCGAETESSSDSGQLAASVETTTEAVSETETEPETTEATTVEETTEAVTEEETTEAEEITEADDENNYILTNAELLSLINNVFGMVSDGTFETDLKTAIAWDVVDEDAVIDPEAKITPEFLVASSMRATGIVTGQDSIEDIINCAVEKDVIESPDLTAIDLSKAVDIVENAQYAWTHRTFENEINVELADGVIDLTDKVNSADVVIDGNTITLPADIANEISAGSVIIIPDGSESGKAYKAESIIDLGDGVITINGSPADFMEVYGFIG